MTAHFYRHLSGVNLNHVMDGHINVLNLKFLIKMTQKILIPRQIIMRLV